MKQKIKQSKTMEKNIEVDEHDKVIGLRPRTDFYTGKYIHRGAHLILKNSKGQILLQKRNKDKKWDPDKFAYSAGGTVAQETYKECILKETKEELGINIRAKKLFRIRYKSDVDNAFLMIYEAVSDDKINFEKKEIQFVKWVSEDYLKKDIEKNPNKYAPVFIIGLQKYFKLTKKRK
jgi:isopentenyldiphosphate isomerase